ncbi:SRPBCC domain-containing protein [Chitinophaga barathri]|uniref:Polyketide cyclase n=1 Tax=Chitinophaga barathri TaxID=1647451 RepID=A0A3N4M4S5_9BACT|nr:SRPBCC domain-containing protein [Chitinophaga barathri]RPD37938.1 polyketide cyclase [Chitinophaga barathri]
MEKQAITVEIFIDAPVEKVWRLWNEPRHIIQWNQPSTDWHTTHVENDAVTDGKFLFVMKAKDGSGGFDFGGVYDEVAIHRTMSYTLSDGRKTTNRFTETAGGTTITETFEPERKTPLNEQERFCASVLETFKKYAETSQ